MTGHIYLTRQCDWPLWEVNVITALTQNIQPLTCRDLYNLYHIHATSGRDYRGPIHDDLLKISDSERQRRQRRRLSADATSGRLLHTHTHTRTYDVKFYDEISYCCSNRSMSYLSKSRDRHNTKLSSSVRSGSSEIKRYVRYRLYTTACFSPLPATCGLL